jgi:hypothetical protein
VNVRFTAKVRKICLPHVGKLSESHKAAQLLEVMEEEMESLNDLNILKVEELPY